MRELIELKAARELAFKKTREIGAAIERSLKDSIASAPPGLKRYAKWLLGGALFLLVAIAGFKYLSYKHEQMVRAAEIAAGPHVQTAKVTKGIGEHMVTVIGETRPFESATLYAKVSGYLRSVRVDKGDVVKQGEVLAMIESPETDEAYIAAEADAKNKRAISARMQTLFAKQLVSQQEAEQALADADVASAKLRSQQTLKGYEILRAPFPGTITARYADPGALVQNAANSQTSALPVVMISQIRNLRVDVFLDQRDAPFVEKNDPIEITLAERPGLKIEGRLSRLSDQLDSRTKMLLAEIDIPNEDRRLVAGSFVQVALKIKSPPYLEAPVEALATKGSKAFLTVITPQNTLTYEPIDIATNDGKVIGILSGAHEGDVLALNVGDTLAEGSKVRPVQEHAP
jgi:RND family efflux transporter MFP subunit